MDTDHHPGRCRNTLSHNKENSIEGDSSSPVPLCTLRECSFYSSKVVLAIAIVGGTL